jgi:hypothetical protein
MRSVLHFTFDRTSFSLTADTHLLWKYNYTTEIKEKFWEELIAYFLLSSFDTARTSQKTTLQTILRCSRDVFTELSCHNRGIHRQTH